MPKVLLSRAVPLTPAQAFAIAADVASYKDFLPWISRSSIRGIVAEQGPVKRFTAALMVEVTKMSVHESFTSHVVADKSAQTVIATSEGGPIKNLRAEWSIAAIDGARSTVALDIDYEFNSKLLQFAAGQMMHYAVNRVLEAFVARGNQLYPASALPNI